MKRRTRKLLLLVVVAAMVSSLTAQIASAGTPIRCGQACQTISFETPPPQDQ